MRTVGRLVPLLVLAALVVIPAAGSAPLAAPTGVHPFYLRSNDALPASYPRTPSFAWDPVEAATSYDFQLATSPTFNDQTQVWATSATGLRVPAVAIPLALPWMTGRPYAFYARVRAHVSGRVTPWSTAFRFNTEGEAPGQLPDLPGLVRWTPVDGATGYEVWFQNLTVDGLQGKVIRTTTNVADEREYYTGHQDPSWTGLVQWSVRAFRLCRLPGNAVCDTLPNALPAVTYGPWSRTFTSFNPPMTSGLLQPAKTVSDAVTTNSGSVAHQLTPGFVFNGNTGANGITGRLYRVYVATDSRCVNVVFTGSVVGSPAYAPRRSGPIVLPPSDADTTGYAADGPQTGTFNAESLAVTTNEQPGDQPTPGNPPVGQATGPTTSLPGGGGPYVDLWDLGRANARYWWTVVPVARAGNAYQDTISRQEACEAGDVMEFSRTSQPTLTSSKSPFASGLSRFGELAAARTMAPSFARSPLVAWQPAKGAAKYDVEWSRTRFPWQAKGSVQTAATSVLLDQLTPGTWYYRVRGIDPYVPGPITQMAWSTPVKVVISKPRFFNESDVSTKRVKK